MGRDWVKSEPWGRCQLLQGKYFKYWKVCIPKGRANFFSNSRIDRKSSAFVFQMKWKCYDHLCQFQLQLSRKPRMLSNWNSSNFLAAIDYLSSDFIVNLKERIPTFRILISRVSTTKNQDLSLSFAKGHDPATSATFISNVFLIPFKKLFQLHAVSINLFLSYP